MTLPSSNWPIDPGGRVDPVLPPQPVDEVTRPAAFTLMAPGWYPPQGEITQSYGFCFTPEGLVVLVQADDACDRPPARAQSVNPRPSAGRTLER